jgi:hypothetical protein
MRASPIVLAVAAVTGFAPAAAGAHPGRVAAERHCVVWIAPTNGAAPTKVSNMRCYTQRSRVCGSHAADRRKGSPTRRPGCCRTPAR